MKTYYVNYTKANGKQGRIMVKALDENQAVTNAKNCCYTGIDFCNPVETTDKYTKPSVNGFSGSNRC